MRMSARRHHASERTTNMGGDARAGDTHTRTHINAHARMCSRTHARMHACTHAHTHLGLNAIVPIPLWLTRFALRFQQIVPPQGRPEEQHPCQAVGVSRVWVPGCRMYEAQNSVAGAGCHREHIQMGAPITDIMGRGHQRTNTSIPSFTASSSLQEHGDIAMRPCRIRRANMLRTQKARCAGTLAAAAAAAHAHRCAQVHAHHALTRILMRASVPRMLAHPPTHNASRARWPARPRPKECTPQDTHAPLHHFLAHRHARVIDAAVFGRRHGDAAAQPLRR